MMQITRNTIDVLKNFSEINNSILIEEGNTVKTISPMKNILATANVGDDFPQKFAIYDLTQFLGLVSSAVFEGANFEFGDSSVMVTNGGAKSKYFYADESTIVVPTKTLNMPDPEINFDLSGDDLSTVRNMASVLQKPDLAVKCNGSGVVLSILDKKDVTTNEFELQVGDSDGVDYQMYFKSENLKLLKGDYEVSISSKGISHFRNKSVDVQYWIALEPDSVYGE